MASGSDEEDSALVTNLKMLMELSKNLTCKALKTENPTDPEVEATIEAGLIDCLIIIGDFMIKIYRF